MEIRAQVAYHFKIDPAKLTTTDPERIPLPEQITRTVSVGEELHTEKLSTIALPPADRSSLRKMIADQVKEATRTARPAGAASVEEEPAPAEEEVSAF